jgi:hypothetical protein
MTQFAYSENAVSVSYLAIVARVSVAHRASARRSSQYPYDESSAGTALTLLALQMNLDRVGGVAVAWNRRSAVTMDDLFNDACIDWSIMTVTELSQEMWPHAGLVASTEGDWPQVFFLPDSLCA